MFETLALVEQSPARKSWRTKRQAAVASSQSREEIEEVVRSPKLLVLAKAWTQAVEAVVQELLVLVQALIEELVAM